MFIFIFLYLNFFVFGTFAHLCLFGSALFRAATASVIQARHLFATCHVQLTAFTISNQFIALPAWAGVMSLFGTSNFTEN